MAEHTAFWGDTHCPKSSPSAKGQVRPVVPLCSPARWHPGLLSFPHVTLVYMGSWQEWATKVLEAGGSAV